MTKVISADSVSILQQLSLVDNVLFQKHKKVILCDCFDTLILRRVHPEHVKKIMTSRLQELLSLGIPSGQLYQMRSKIEGDLCAASMATGHDQEFSIEDLIIHLHRSLVEKKLINVTLDLVSFRKIFLDLELNSEFVCQEIDHDVYNALVRWKAAGIPLILVSDFYFPKDVFSQVLRFHQLDDLFTELYISANYHLTKKTGKLYQLLFDDLKIHPREAIMIGDNQYADFLMPMSLNVESFLLPRTEQYRFYQRTSSISHSFRYLQKNLPDLFLLGKNRLFEGLIVSLYIFIFRLYYSLYRAGAKDVFFLSREGEYLIKLFEIFQSSFFPDRKIKVHYLLVSRKSTFIGSLGPLKDEKFDRLFRQYRRFSLRSFLMSLNFNDEEQRLVALAIEEDMDLVVEDFPMSKIFQKLLLLDVFRKLYEFKRSEQSENFQQYLQSFGVDFSKQALHLVDVGWKGTIQDNIKCMLGDTTSIVGHYLGLVWDPMVSSTNIKEGLLFSCKNKVMPDFGVFDENKSLFEVFLGASHGSANHYLKQDGKIKVMLSAQPDEYVLFRNHVRPLQDKLLAKFQTLVNFLSLSSLSLADIYKSFLHEHRKLVFAPTKLERSWFQSLKHYENFGVFNFAQFAGGKIGRLQKFKNMFYLLTAPRKFLTQFFWPVLSFDVVFFPGGRQLYRLVRHGQFFFTKK